MIMGSRLCLRPVEERDWSILQQWGKHREGLWGPYQRFQLDHLPLLRRAFEQGGLLKRESGLLLAETLRDPEVIGYVRYTLIPLPDSDQPCPEIGFGVPAAHAQGQGYAKEAVMLLVGYLFDGYPVERITAFTDVENAPAQRVMEGVGFQREGVLRRAMFRDGLWRDIAVYGIVRTERAAGK